MNDYSRKGRRAGKWTRLSYEFHGLVVTQGVGHSDSLATTCRRNDCG